MEELNKAKLKAENYLKEVVEESLYSLTVATRCVDLPGFAVPSARQNFFFVSPVAPGDSARPSMPNGLRNGASGCGSGNGKLNS